MWQNEVHLALVLEDDPGRELGMARQPGHRFFSVSLKSSPYKQPIVIDRADGRAQASILCCAARDSTLPYVLTRARMAPLLQATIAMTMPRMTLFQSDVA